MTDVTDPRHSPLHAVHESLGASFTDFAGWLMPVRYSSDLAEHHAVRTAAGIFDISHMAEIRVTGTDAAAFLDRALAGLISAVPLGRAKYSLILVADGGILDDLIVYHDRQDEYLVVANAGNRAVVVKALQDRSAGFDVKLDDLTDELVLIAVQGPASRAIVEATLSVPEMATLKYYACTSGTFADETILVARTGYTGEDGYELYVSVAHAEPLWRALAAAGAPHGLVPAGLASRDTLRLEAGMPLYGHELGLNTLPVQAGLGRVVNLTKDFVGKSGIEAGPAPDARVLVGLISEGKRAGRAGYPVMQGDAEVGEITSGALSPTLGYPIAMAYVDSGASAPGTQLDIDVRGSRVAASVVSLPFYKREA
ncbi:MAG: glycine cleavage system aminomethyltransferase GcvT [Salinibacterium sp.]|nr:glycine cleavage system aminomethyltransferase GcvT [Salinibacterium sp.]